MSRTRLFARRAAAVLLGLALAALPFVHSRYGIGGHHADGHHHHHGEGVDHAHRAHS